MNTMIRLVDGLGNSRRVEYVPGLPTYKLVIPLVINPRKHTELSGGFIELDFVRTSEYDRAGLPVYRDKRTYRQEVPIRYNHTSRSITYGPTTADARAGSQQADARPADRRGNSLFGTLRRSRDAAQGDQGRTA